MQGKINAAKEGLRFVKDNSIIGLGSGSTSLHFIKLLGKKVKEEGLNILCVPSSFESRICAINNGLKVVELDEVDRIHLAIDGADMVDRKLNLIKGKGGALTREKIIDYSAEDLIILIEEKKLAERIKGIVPIEVIPFSYSIVKKKLEKISVSVSLRVDNSRCGPIITDNNNFLLDAVFEEIKNPEKLEMEIKNIPGVVENGIFTRNVSKVIVGKRKGVNIIP